MANSGENPRIQVFINGESRAIAGLESVGAISFILDWIRRNPDTAPPEAFSVSGHTRESWRDGIPRVGVGALDVQNQLDVEWIREKLQVGDEVVVRILPPGDIDAPIASSPHKVPRSKRQRPSQDLDHNETPSN